VLSDEQMAGLRLIGETVFETSQRKGWHEQEARHARLLVALSAAREAENAGMAIPVTILDVLRDMEDQCRVAHGVNIGEQLMLVVTEAAEAMEAYRDAQLDIAATYTKKDGALVPWTPGAKPEGFGSELADIIIRVMHMSKRFGIDVAAEIDRKLEYNTRRTFRHGGKRV